MTEVKDITLSSLVFHLKYLTDQAIGTDINNDNCGEMIEVFYEPLPPISKIEVDAIFKKKEEKLLDQICLVLKNNRKFYSQFYISLKFVKTAYKFENELVTVDKVTSASKFLKITMKEN
jgi:hypothetical protein